MVAATTNTKTSSSKPGKVNGIGNFTVDKIDDVVMRKYIADSEIPSDKIDNEIEGTEQLGVALSLYFRETVKKDDMCKCERCGGEGPADAQIDGKPACAFCGLEGEADEADATDTAALAVAVEATEPKSGSKKKASSKKAAADKPAKAAKGALEVVPEVAAEVVVAGEKELDQSVARIIVLKANASGSLRALGVELLHVHTTQLWKQRLNAKGKGAYTSFDSFVETEARIGTQYAYTLIEIAKNFTEADVAKFGTSKLSLLLKVDAKDRPALQEKAETSTKRQLKEAVDEVVKQRGGNKQKSTRHQAAGNKSGAAAKKKKAKSDKITVALIEKKHTIKMFAKPESLRNLDWSTLKRAKTLDAMPFGKLELTNEVSIIITLVKKEDGIEAIATIKRDGADE